MSKTRLEAFTDAVIAIIMTILVLRLNAPAEATFAALWAARYRFLIYALSFFSLAVYWNNHHHLLQAAQRVTGRVLWSNILFLFFLSLFPYAASWVDENLTETVPEVFYGLVVIGTHLSFALLRRALIVSNGPDSIVAKALCGSKKMVITLGVNVAGLLAGFVFPPAVMLLYALSMVLWVVPEKRIEAFFP